MLGQAMRWLAVGSSQPDRVETLLDRTIVPADFDTNVKGHRRSRYENQGSQEKVGISQNSQVLRQ